MLTQEARVFHRCGRRFHKDCSIFIADNPYKLKTMLPGSKPILELTVLQQTRLPPPMVDSPKFLMRSNRKIKFEIIEIFALDMHNI